ncbi:hypothetical protein DFP73DRAFT_618458 [Morchella snyderi]|nr:hypothetical protein DFP73DRAFT_618458 [Morchella snyderi]
MPAGSVLGWSSYSGVRKVLAWEAEELAEEFESSLLPEKLERMRVVNSGVRADQERFNLELEKSRGEKREENETKSQKPSKERTRAMWSIWDTERRFLSLVVETDKADTEQERVDQNLDRSVQEMRRLRVEMDLLRGEKPKIKGDKVRLREEVDRVTRDE